MKDDRLYAVLSGDIVGSRRFSGVGPVIRDAIKGAYLSAEETFGGALLGVDVFRGDSWQLLIDSPALALRSGLLMRALMKANEQLPKIDSRLAIGVGTVEFVDRANLSESQGEAFVLSGEALDGLRDMKVRMAVRFPEARHDAHGAFEAQATLDVVMALLDTICQEWTARQSAAIAGALMRLGQTQIGERLAITQPAVSQALSAARWGPVDHAVSWWEHIRWRAYADNT